MIAQHTITHAIQYLRDAIREQRQCVLPTSDAGALGLVDPNRPCAAYGLAKRTLKRCRTLSAAIADLQLQLRETSHEN